MSRTNENTSADIVAFFGATGSGKTYNMLKDCQKEKRILAFDPTGTLSGQGFEGFSDIGTWFRAAVNSGPGRYALQMTGAKNFAAWCECVMALADARRPCTVLVDELGGVTSAAKAPEHWHNIISLGRKYGLKIRAGAQRPQEIDKTLIGNKSGLWIGYTARQADAEYLARETGIDLQTILDLEPKPKFDHIWYRGRGDYQIVKK